MTEDELKDISPLGKHILSVLSESPTLEQSTFDIGTQIEERTGRKFVGLLVYPEVFKLEEMDLVTTRSKDSKKPERDGKPERMVKLSELGRKVAPQIEVEQRGTVFGDLSFGGATSRSGINTGKKGFNR